MLDSRPFVQLKRGLQMGSAYLDVLDGDMPPVRCVHGVQGKLSVLIWSRGAGFPIVDRELIVPSKGEVELHVHQHAVQAEARELVDGQPSVAGGVSDRFENLGGHKVRGAHQGLSLQPVCDRAAHFQAIVMFKQVRAHVVGVYAPELLLGCAPTIAEPAANVRPGFLLGSDCTIVRLLENPLDRLVDYLADPHVETLDALHFEREFGFFGRIGRVACFRKVVVVIETPRAFFEHAGSTQ